MSTILGLILIAFLLWAFLLKLRSKKTSHVKSKPGIRIYKERWWWNIDKNLLQVVAGALLMCGGLIGAASLIVYVGLKFT